MLILQLLLFQQILVCYFSISHVFYSFVLDQKEFHAGSRLAVIVRKTLKSRKADYGRLVLDFTHTTNLHDAILRKNEMRITAPVIVALGTHPEVTFYICIDDDILRVSLFRFFC